jgi:hypothetical protein
MTGNNTSSSDAFISFLAQILTLLAIVSLSTAYPVLADSDLEKDLKVQNAKHLDQKLTLHESRKPATVERDYEEKLKRKSWKLSEGPISIHVSLTKGGPPDGMLFQTPVLSLMVDGKKILNVEGSESFPDNPVFLVQIAEMDPGNPYAEVVFSTYTGGAHCCSDTRVLTSSKDGKSWQTIELSPLDGGPLEVKDLDGDGRYEFALRDNAFIYRFGCYACSSAPFHVLKLQDGKLVDASSDPAFRPRHVKSLQDIIDWAGDGMDLNGFFPGYIGQKILLGEGAQAWKLMLKYYDRKGDWGLEHCSVKENDKGECPKGKKVILSYPQALERFFKEAGYKLKK